MNTSSSYLQTESGRKLQETLDRVTKGIRDPEASRKALERLDQGREEMRQRIAVDVIVPILPEFRD